MRPGGLPLLSLLAAAALAFGAHAAGRPAFTDWDAAKDGAPKVYRSHGLTLTARRGKTAKGDPAPVLVIADGRTTPFTVRGAEVSGDTYMLSFAAVALDRQIAGPQVLMNSFTFGAHCCFHYTLAAKVRGRWTTFGFGDWDGAGMPVPKDINGDGRLELLAGDQAFLYAFDSYAGSDVPAEVFEVRGGKLVDVSKDPRYRKAYEADASRQKAACEDGGAGACAAYAATLARLGRVEDAWPLVAKAGPGQGGADPADPAIFLPDGKKRVFRNFRESLEWFLADHGYIPMTVATPKGRLVEPHP